MRERYATTSSGYIQAVTMICIDIEQEMRAYFVRFQASDDFNLLAAPFSTFMVSILCDPK